MRILGTDLRTIRLNAGKTTVQMAKFAGVKTRKTYENWEKNRGTPNINQFIAMANECGFSATELMRQTEARSDNQPFDLDKACL